MKWNRWSLISSGINIETGKGVGLWEHDTLPRWKVTSIQRQGDHPSQLFFPVDFHDYSLMADLEQARSLFGGMVRFAMSRDAEDADWQRDGDDDTNGGLLEP